jgi:hypothetical protein
MPDASVHRQPRVRKIKSTQAKSPQVHRLPRHSLHDGFNGFLRALPGERALLSPSQAQCESTVANLMPASRHQDHTAWPSAYPRIRLVRDKRPPHPAPNVFVTIAKRPSCGHGTAENVLVICPTSQAKVPAARWHDGQIALDLCGVDDPERVRR